MTYFLKWINDIKGEKSQSTAILERLFNITFFKNDGVIPFYYERKLAWHLCFLIGIAATIKEGLEMIREII